MKKHNRLKRMLAGLAVSSLTLLASCADQTPQSVRNFSSIYEGREDNEFQREIYNASRNNLPLADSTISGFFACAEEGARAYATAQKQAYDAIIEIESKRKNYHAAGFLAIQWAFDESLKVSGLISCLEKSIGK